MKADARQDRIRDQLRKRGLDAVVLTIPDNVFYATEYASNMERWALPEPICAAIVHRDPSRPVILCLPEANVALLAVLADQGTPDRADELRVLELLTFCEVGRILDPYAPASSLAAASMEIYGKRVKGKVEPDLPASIAVTLREHGLDRAQIGFDDLRIHRRVSASDGLGGLEGHDALDLMVSARVVKTPEELAIFRSTGKLADQVITYAATRAVPGAIWNHVQRDIASYMISLDISPVDEGAMLFGGAYAGKFIPELFRTRSDRPLVANQIVILETLGRAKGFWIDINRTSVLGKPNPDYQRLHDIVRDGYLRSIEAMKPGAHTEDMARIAYRHIKENGVLSPEKLLVFAHGVGHMPVEIPVPFPAYGLAGARGFTIEENMAISLDCLFFGNALGPCHMENVFVIEKNGARSLYDLPLELMGPR